MRCIAYNWWRHKTWKWWCFILSSYSLVQLVHEHASTYHIPCPMVAVHILNIALINSCTTTAWIIVLLPSECVIRVWGEGDPGDISKYTQQRDEPPPPDNHGTHATEASLGQQTNRVLQIQASVRRVSRSLSLLNLRSSWCCWGCIPFLMSHKCGFVVNDTLGLVSRQILIINVFFE